MTTNELHIVPSETKWVDGEKRHQSWKKATNHRQWPRSSIPTAASCQPHHPRIHQRPPMPATIAGDQRGATAAWVLGNPAEVRRCRVAGTLPSNDAGGGGWRRTREGAEGRRLVATWCGPVGRGGGVRTVWIWGVLISRLSTIISMWFPSGCCESFTCYLRCTDQGDWRRGCEEIDQGMLKPKQRVGDGVRWQVCLGCCARRMTSTLGHLSGTIQNSDLNSLIFFSFESHCG
jgi:hypothetical protein